MTDTSEATTIPVGEAYDVVVGHDVLDRVPGLLRPGVQRVLVVHSTAQPDVAARVSDAVRTSFPPLDTAEKQRAFWMHETKIPLSIAFLNAQGRIVHTADMTPFDETPVPSEAFRPPPPKEG